jgi:hypothetical protein
MLLQDCPDKDNDHSSACLRLFETLRHLFLTSRSILRRHQAGFERSTSKNDRIVAARQAHETRHRGGTPSFGAYHREKAVSVPHTFHFLMHPAASAFGCSIVLVDRGRCRQREYENKLVFLRNPSSKGIKELDTK